MYYSKSILKKGVFIMTKKTKTYRLDQEVIKKIEDLSKFFSTHAPVTSIGKTIDYSNTDIVQIAVNHYYETIKEQYDLD
jgi:hypothetical protein